jgi:MFS family permease
MNMTAQGVGLTFFGWGVALALASVFLAPRLQAAFGTIPSALGALIGFALVLAAMAIWTDHRAVLVAGVVVAGLFLGINNTLVTETVMHAAPVERGVASAAYSFVRFSGGAVAPWLAGYLGETINDHVPYWVGAVAVLMGATVLAASRRHLAHIDGQSHAVPLDPGSPAEGSEITGTPESAYP